MYEHTYTMGFVLFSKVTHTGVTKLVSFDPVYTILSIGLQTNLLFSANKFMVYKQMYGSTPSFITGTRRRELFHTQYSTQNICASGRSPQLRVQIKA